MFFVILEAKFLCFFLDIVKSRPSLFCLSLYIITTISYCSCVPCVEKKQLLPLKKMLHHAYHVPMVKINFTFPPHFCIFQLS